MYSDKYKDETVHPGIRPGLSVENPLFSRVQESLEKVSFEVVNEDESSLSGDGGNGLKDGEGPMGRCAGHGGSGAEKKMRWEKTVEREAGVGSGGILGHMLRNASTMEDFTATVKAPVIQCPITETFKNREWGLT